MSSNRDAVPRGVVVRKDLAPRWDDRSQQKGDSRSSDPTLEVLELEVGFPEER